MLALIEALIDFEDALMLMAIFKWATDDEGIPYVVHSDLFREPFHVRKFHRLCVSQGKVVDVRTTCCGRAGNPTIRGYIKRCDI